MRSVPALLSLLLLAPMSAAQGPDARHRWVFDRAPAHGDRVRAVRGGLEGVLLGGARLITLPGKGGLSLDGKDDSVLLGQDLARYRLPKKSLSVEAWVALDEPREWGGLLGAVQDNGGFEKGWLLGFRGDRFAFALSTVGADDGDGLLTYLTGGPAFGRGRWHHVVGTYDGKLQVLYVDGEPVASSEHQKGAILYPQTAFFEIGAYHDRDENHRTAGLLREVALFAKALTPEQVLRRFRRGRVPPPKPAVTLGRWIFSPARLDGRRFPPVAGKGDATLQGTLGLHGDEKPGSLLFKGDEGAAVAFPAGLRRSLGEVFTAGVWFHPSEGDGIILGATEDGRTGWWLGMQGGRVVFSLASKGLGGEPVVLPSPSPAVCDRWHHTAARYDGVTMELFVDGVSVGRRRSAHGPVAYGSRDATSLGGAPGLAAFRGRVHEVSLHQGVVSAGTIGASYRAGRHLLPRGLQLAVSLCVQHLGPRTLQVTWETYEAGTTVLTYGTTEARGTRVEDAVPKTRHRVVLKDVAPETMVHMAVETVRGGGDRVEICEPFTIDTTFEYLPVVTPERPYPFEDDGRRSSFEAAATRILEELGTKKGWGLVLEAGEGRLAYELARRSDLKLVALESDPDKVLRARLALARAGLHGSRVTVHRGDLKDLPYADYFANLVVCGATVTTGKGVGSLAALSRLVSPAGGLVCFGTPGIATGSVGQARSWLAGLPAGEVEVSTDGGLWATWRRGKLPGGEDWTHQYARGDNSTCNEDALAHGDLEVLWFGRPGPRPMVDRGSRPPAPLFANGRLFVQGKNILFGLDGYNGTIRWSRFIPAMRRTNIPRDCSNMVADDAGVLVAVEGTCWRVDGETGERTRAYAVPDDLRLTHHWGYVGRVSTLLLGSATLEGSAYQGADGEWYDKGGEEGRKVVSDALFARDVASGTLAWQHRAGLVVNATITTSGEHIWFVETPRQEAGELWPARVGVAHMDGAALVCLDTESGKELWRRPVDASRSDRSLFLAHAGNTLVLTGTHQAYHVAAFDARTGRPRWTAEHRWARDHHGGGMQHAVIVDGIVYLEKKAYDLRSGKLLREDLPERRGCGVMAASAGAFFYRHHWHGYWDLETDARVEWSGVRGGCWLGMIPAGGVVLAPETSSGCSCTHPIQTSLAFVPRRERTR